MKSLISVTPKEFKHHFGEIMDLCTSLCMSMHQDIIVTIPVSKGASFHEEIARVVYAGGGHAYVYNEEVLKKHGINTTNSLQAKIETIIADAIEKSGMAEKARKYKGAAKMTQEIMLYASKEITKLIASCDFAK